MLCLAGVAGCVSATAVPDADRAQLQRELRGATRFVRVSLYQSPFWSDPSRTLLSAAPPSELPAPRGAPTPQPTAIVPAGRRVTLIRVSLPTGPAVAHRPAGTPRAQAWVVLRIAGAPAKAPPAVWVMPGHAQSREQFLAALSRVFAVDSPSGLLSTYGDDTRAAIAAKQVLRDMDPAAVTFAWGVPGHRTVNLAGGTRTEAWTWADGGRTVHFVDGKVTQVQGQPPALSAPADGGA